MHTDTHPSHDEQIERLARRRAAAKLGWYLHAAVYVLVNLGLLALSAASGRHWAIYPALGWGIGLLAHGVAVFALSGSGQLYERMVQAERTRIHSKYL